MLNNIFLPGLVLIPVIAGIFSWLSEPIHRHAPRLISLLGMGAVLGLLLAIWPEVYPQGWWSQYQAEWIPALGVRFHFALDGLSALMVLLAAVLGVVAVLSSWREVEKNIGLFHLHLSLLLAGVIGVFLSVDLFLFFVCWEVLLLPMYFLINSWGHNNSTGRGQTGKGRQHAALKFFIYGQASGLLMLIAILALAFFHYAEVHILTFDYETLKHASLPQGIDFLIMLGFFIAFAVKLPVVPFHGWLADAHEHAPTGASVDITGLLLKISAYGILRFCLPLFPDASQIFAPIALALGVFSIMYGGILAYGQTHIKRLIAYSSISHMGFILIGIYSFNFLALQGVVVLMVAGALSTAALFVLAGQLYERLGTFDTQEMGGLWSRLPLLPPLLLFFAAATLGLPGLGNFIGEILILLGAFKVAPIFVIASTLSMVLAAVYSLALLHRTIYGSSCSDTALAGPGYREKLILMLLAVGLLIIGLYPQPLLDAVAQTIQSIVR